MPTLNPLYRDQSTLWRLGNLKRVTDIHYSIRHFNLPVYNSSRFTFLFAIPSQFKVKMFKEIEF